MTLRRSLLVGLLIVPLALLSSSVNSAVKTQANQPSGVVFVVFGEKARGVSPSMEPILILNGGKLSEPVSGGSDGDEIKRFSNEHYRKGARYRVLFGGAEAGTATITQSSINEECFRTGAEITLQTDAKLNNNVMALATDSKSLGLAASERSRRAPTQAERAQALELARAAYKQKGVAAAMLPTMEVVNLTAIDLDRDGKAELAGSFVASKRTRGQERYAVFLLATPEGSNYRTAFSNFNKVTEKDMMSGASINAVNGGLYVERLVDHLDLDNDGTSELITTSTGLEGVTYYIYKRQNGAWNKVYEFGNYRCAF